MPHPVSVLAREDVSLLHPTYVGCRAILFSTFRMKDHSINTTTLLIPGILTRIAASTDEDFLSLCYSTHSAVLLDDAGSDTSSVCHSRLLGLVPEIDTQSTLDGAYVSGRRPIKPLHTGVPRRLPETPAGTRNSACHFHRTRVRPAHVAVLTGTENTLFELSGFG